MSKRRSSLLYIKKTEQCLKKVCSEEIEKKYSLSTSNSFLAGYFFFSIKLEKRRSGTKRLNVKRLNMSWEVEHVSGKYPQHIPLLDLCLTAGKKNHLCYKKKTKQMNVTT